MQTLTEMALWRCTVFLRNSSRSIKLVIVIDTNLIRCQRKSIDYLMKKSREKPPITNLKNQTLQSKSSLARLASINKLRKRINLHLKIQDSLSLRWLLSKLRIKIRRKKMTNLKIFVHPLQSTQRRMSVDSAAIQFCLDLDPVSNQMPNWLILAF